MIRQRSQCQPRAIGAITFVLTSIGLQLVVVGDTPATNINQMVFISTMSSPYQGIRIGTDEPAKHAQSPYQYIQISQKEAASVLAFLTKTEFVKQARFRRGLQWPTPDTLMFHFKHDGIMRTDYCYPTLRFLGYLERLSDRLSPEPQQRLLSYVDTIKARYYRMPRGSDLLGRWLSDSRAGVKRPNSTLRHDKSLNRRGGWARNQ